MKNKGIFIVSLLIVLGVMATIVFSVIVLIIFVGTDIERRPHIILILADELGYNDVPWHNDKILAPTMEKLAKEGIILESAYVQPFGTQSRAALTTGYYPIHTGRQDGASSTHLRSEDPAGLYTNFTLLPEWLSKMGYHTHMIGKWHLGLCHESTLPMNRGYRTFYGVSRGPDGYDYYNGTEVDLQARNKYSPYLFAKMATDRIADHAKRYSEDPLFLYIGFTAVSLKLTPLGAPPELMQMYPREENETSAKYKRRRFSAMVSGVDIAIGQIVDQLKQERLYEDSIILFLSDNGGPITAGASNYPLRGLEKSTLWEGGSRVPAFIHSPLLQNKSTVYHGLIHVTDWLPSFYSASGGNVNELGLIDGINQWNNLKVLGTSSRKEMLYNSNPQTVMLNAQTPTGSALRWGAMKLMIGEPAPGFVVEPGYYPNNSVLLMDQWSSEDHVQLFDLANDPYESKNLASEQPELVANMLSRLKDIEKTAIEPFVREDLLEGNPKQNVGVWGPGWCNVPNLS